MASKKNETPRRNPGANRGSEYIRHWSDAVHSKHPGAIAPGFAKDFRAQKKMAPSESDRALQFSPMRSDRSRFRKSRRGGWHWRHAAKWLESRRRPRAGEHARFRTRNARYPGGANAAPARKSKSRSPEQLPRACR